ncbi:hypothetical protein FBZ94_12026 [Bradyrhizobium sacchari]|uniref:Uncharacterized protein n=1 Tax=Bradyrhizobium sacchari TaxID=1399419 RepID=A0A560HL69_9BRAD|nr:hypothetical protein FBZ94_12026 [Bradyrhizobium sacchari]TWB66012.1 hypothetical protein FBZ95_1198 [Bradyrhizobium sacchari]
MELPISSFIPVSSWSPLASTCIAVTETLTPTYEPRSRHKRNRQRDGQVCADLSASICDCRSEPFWNFRLIIANGRLHWFGEMAFQAQM